jgi:hypothetical protein
MCLYFVVGRDTTLALQVIDISSLLRIPDVHQRRKVEDFGAGFEIEERGASGHPERLAGRRGCVKPSASDNTTAPEQS